MGKKKTIMSVNEKNIIDFKMHSSKEEAPTFSSGLYHWMMFLINFYNRVKKKFRY